jgi:hypothetical protein
MSVFSNINPLSEGAHWGSFGGTAIDIQGAWVLRPAHRAERGEWRGTGE